MFSQLCIQIASGTHLISRAVFSVFHFFFSEHHFTAGIERRTFSTELHAYSGVPIGRPSQRRNEFFPRRRTLPLRGGEGSVPETPLLLCRKTWVQGISYAADMNNDLFSVIHLEKKSGSLAVLECGFYCVYVVFYLCRFSLSGRAIGIGGRRRDRWFLTGCDAVWKESFGVRSPMRKTDVLGMLKRNAYHISNHHQMIQNLLAGTRFLQTTGIFSISTKCTVLFTHALYHK